MSNERVCSMRCMLHLPLKNSFRSRHLPSMATTLRSSGRAERNEQSTAPSAELDYRPSYLAALVVAAIVFVLYLLTLAPSTAMWDTSEYIASAYILGLPHPPGNPFFVLLGRFFAILPIAPNVAMRINILAALCSAGAAGMWVLITQRVLVGWLAERLQRAVGS